MKTVLCVLALAAALAPAAASAAVVRAPDIEQRVHTPYEVYCVSAPDWPRPDAFGLADIPNERVFLRDDVCASVREPTDAATHAVALLVLFHELSHVGWQNPNESATECFALLIYRAMLRHYFGMTAPQAQSAYDLAWKRHLLQPPEYQGCAYSKRDLVS